MTNTDILWIEGKRAGSPPFISELREKGYQIETVPTGKAARRSLGRRVPNAVVVNAASLGTSGTRICKSLRSKVEDLPIILIISPKHAPARHDVEANVLLILPFTIRKLVNRITPFLSFGRGKVIRAGDIHLDLKNLIVRCEGRASHLTPRMAQLLKILIDKRGEIVKREQLFRQVWKTTYTDDTRTLDVHMSWLRKAVEEDPRQPQYIRTVRGVGYRLDV
jgi:DNA-binding response OmpR family regulator